MAASNHSKDCGIDTCGDGLPCDCPCHETVEERTARHLNSLRPEERVEFLQKVAEGFCTACGYDLLPGENCHCENDD